ncbi:TPA: helix-turn-helix domain-containing protein [Citrobacter freundii]
MATKITDNDNFIHQFSFSARTKPVKSIESLFLLLIPYSKEILVPKNTIYRINNFVDGKGILLISDGIGTVIHAEKDYHICTAYPPTILGLVGGYSAFYEIPHDMNHDLSLYADTDLTCFFIPLEKFVEVMDQNNSWHDVSRILAHRLMIMISKDSEHVEGNTYQKIKTLIYEVWSYPTEYRLQINLPNFIQKRTGISRSRVMKILMDLRQGGYIEVTNGKLRLVSKLPQNY